MGSRELNPPLVLASASPQRRAILERLGVAFEVRPTDVAELEQGDPVEAGRGERDAQGTRGAATGCARRRCWAWTRW